MIEAPLHDSESERLRALRDYDVLDTDAEQVFDDLTQLASEICETPISLISLVDPNRQWFKSKVGIDADSTPRSIAFCAHAILQEDVFEVSNALQDERFHDNPLVTEDPNIRFYAGTPLTTPDGFPIGTLCVISDKSKKLSEHQKNALKILGRQVITQLELRIKTRKLEQANQFKTEFLSNISHEIRTPLNAIVGFSELLIEHKDEYFSSDTAKEYSENIEYSSRHLLSIVNSILDLSKIEAGKMELDIKEFDVANNLQKLVNMLSVKAEEKGVELNFQLDDHAHNRICLDQHKLSQIVINLVGNAIKFTEADKQVTLSVSTAHNNLLVTVEDQGVGMTAQELATVFDKYTQVGKNKQGGTGLGLSITKGLVELMAGNITIESDKNSGTKVAVNIPLTAKCSPQAPEEVEQLTISGKKLLVVEDNLLNQRLVGAMLDNLNVDARFAETAEDALTLLEKHVYDVILMDINLPGISGIDATVKIKQRGIATPVVALTADVFAAREETEVFDGYLTKPITREQLQLALARTLKAN